MAEHCEFKYRFETDLGKRFDNRERVCNRAVFRNGRCFFHLDDPNKSIEFFLIEFKKLLESTHKMYINLCGFSFPETDLEFKSLIEKQPINKLLLMENCIFHGNISFMDCSFEQGVSFYGSKFRSRVTFGDEKNAKYSRAFFNDVTHFNKVEFGESVSFAGCKFEVIPEFIGTHFHREAFFTKAYFNTQFNLGPAKFVQCEFAGPTVMDIEGGRDFNGILFSECNLLGLKFLTLPRKTDKFNVDYINTKKWYQCGKLFGRNAIIDESQDKERPGRVIDIIDCYRNLEKYFYDHSDFNLARDFHIGQMVAMRKDKNYGRTAKAVNWLYQKLSNYGESILRPLFALIFSLLIFPLILLLSGIKVYDKSDGIDYITNVNYNNVGDRIERSGLRDTYWSTFAANLSLSTFDRKHELAPRSDSFSKGILVFETVLNVIFASLIVIAVRRKFTPKTPQGE